MVRKRFPQAVVEMIEFRGEQTLVLHDEQLNEVIARVHLRPRLAAGWEELRRSCERRGVELSVAGVDHRLQRVEPQANGRAAAIAPPLPMREVAARSQRI